MQLLRIETNDGFMYFFLGLGALILWYYLIRWSVRANDIVKNQELIIHLMIQQYKKQGATVEEMKKLEEMILNK
jgi:hypothetical protein